jgi:hypothetical protein
MTVDITIAASFEISTDSHFRIFRYPYIAKKQANTVDDKPEQKSRKTQKANPDNLSPLCPI